MEVSGCWILRLLQRVRLSVVKTGVSSGRVEILQIGPVGACLLGLALSR
jgi:hypothetical protein